MVAKEYNGKLNAVTSLTGSSTGNWYTPMELCDDSQMPFSLQMSGTGTWTLMGRNGPNDTPETLFSSNTSKTMTVPKFREFCLSFTGATALTARGSIPYPIRQTG